jgi:hypothetical protein
VKGEAVGAAGVGEGRGVSATDVLLQASANNTQLRSPIHGDCFMCKDTTPGRQKLRLGFLSLATATDKATRNVKQVLRAIDGAAQGALRQAVAMSKLAVISVCRR